MASPLSAKSTTMMENNDFFNNFFVKCGPMILISHKGSNHEALGRMYQHDDTITSTTTPIQKKGRNKIKNNRFKIAQNEILRHLAIYIRLRRIKRNNCHMLEYSKIFITQAKNEN